MALPPNENIAAYRNAFYPTVTTVAGVLDAIITDVGVLQGEAESFVPGGDAPVSFAEGDAVDKTYAVLAAAGPLYDDSTIFINDTIGENYATWTAYATGTVEEGEAVPSDGAGVAAAVGSVYVQHETSASAFVGLFLKTGSGDTAWTDVTDDTYDAEVTEPVSGAAGTTGYDVGAIWTDDDGLLYTNTNTSDEPTWTSYVQQPGTPTDFTQTYTTVGTTVSNVTYAAPTQGTAATVLTGTNIAAKTPSATLTDAVNTNAGTVATSLDQAQADLGTQINSLRTDLISTNAKLAALAVDALELRKLVTQIIDILQAAGLAA